MRFEYSPDVRALYVHLRPPGDAPEIAETVELDTEILADLDAAGEPVGIEFVDAHDFFPFLARHADQTGGGVAFDLPDALVAIARGRMAAPTT